MFSSLLRGVKGEWILSSDSVPTGLSTCPVLTVRTSSFDGDFKLSDPDVILIYLPSFSSSSLSLRKSEESSVS